MQDGERPEDITRILADIGDGVPCATDRLYRVLGPDLRDQARRHLQSYNQRTMMPTELVNEAFVHMKKRGQLAAENRGHFYALSARAMKDVIIERIRNRKAAKRSPNGVRKSLTDLAVGTMTEDDLLDLNEALVALHANDPRCHEIVMHKFFNEMTIEQIAELMSLSQATVSRDWQMAKAFLHKNVTERRNS